MPAHPKLNPEQWHDVRVAWESDPREGYTWLVEELGLPVSPPAVRKTAIRDKWSKQPVKKPTAGKKPSQETNAKPSRGAAGSKITPRKVSANNLPDAPSRKTIETIDQKPNTLEGAVVESALRDLSGRQALFVREYLVDMNGTQAAIRAGFSPNCAGVTASQLLKTHKIRAALNALQAERIARLDIDADELVKHWHGLLRANQNSITQYRRVPCRHCWGKNFGYQYTPGEFQRATVAWAEKRAKMLERSKGEVDIGEFAGVDGDWYYKLRDPNPECPECFGDGVGETFIPDTRNLSGADLALYAGVKETREGIEVKTHSQERAAEYLGRVLGVFVEKDVEVNVGVVSGADLARIYEERMRLARERQQDVLAERGYDEPAE